MSPLMQRAAIVQFQGANIVWTTEAQLSQERALLTSTCPCCELSLELIAELATFQGCAEYATRRADPLLMAA